MTGEPKAAVVGDVISPCGRVDELGDVAAGVAQGPRAGWTILPRRASIALVLLAAWHAPAVADFRVCNKTRSLINLAVGMNAGDVFATEGWWTVTPGSCATPIHGPLTGRYVYLYATDIAGADVLKGTVSMCIDRGKFKVFGVENCWRRGLEAVTFAEIDTLDAPDWTTFLKEPGR